MNFYMLIHLLYDIIKLHYKPDYTDTLERQPYENYYPYSVWFKTPDGTSINFQLSKYKANWGVQIDTSIRPQQGPTKYHTLKDQCLNDYTPTRLLEALTKEAPEYTHIWLKLYQSFVETIHNQAKEQLEHYQQTLTTPLNIQ